MDLFEFLSDITRLPGVSGHEMALAERLRAEFDGLGMDTRIDSLQNVIASTGTAGPHIMVAAHMDEIALMVTAIEEDGSLRVTSVGGLPARVLPASCVTVHAHSGALFGVIGAKAPHLLSPQDQKLAVQMKDLYVDVGLPVDRVRAQVSVGDLVTMEAPLVKLLGDRVAGKTLDDRACVAGMVLAAARVKKLHLDARVSFVATTQEEVGCRGAGTAAFHLQPDIAIAIDVTHAESPGADKWEAFPIDQLTIGIGPNMHPALSKRLMKIAEENRIGYQVEPCGHATGTDARSIQIAGTGVPTLLIGVPLKYMHSSVEMIDLTVLNELGRLIALFIAEASECEEVRAWN